MTAPAADDESLAPAPEAIARALEILARQDRNTLDSFVCGYVAQALDDEFATLGDAAWRRRCIRAARAYLKAWEQLRASRKACEGGPWCRCPGSPCPSKGAGK